MDEIPTMTKPRTEYQPPNEPAGNPVSAKNVTRRIPVFVACNGESEAAYGRVVVIDNHGDMWLWTDNGALDAEWLKLSPLPQG